MDWHKDFLCDELACFKNLTQPRRVIVGQEIFVYINNIAYNEKLMYHINMRFDNLHENFKCKCVMHNRNCKSPEESLALVMYLNIIEGKVKKVDMNQNKKTFLLNLTMQRREKISTLQMKECKLLLDLVTLKLETLKEDMPVEDFDVQSNNYDVCILPSLIIQGKEYVFLNDIECHYNLREGMLIFA